MQHDTQAVVIGGGPSGAWCAEQLVRRGIAVVLLEAGDAPEKLCSGLLNTEGQHALGCELPQHVRREPFQPRLEFHDADNRLRLRYQPGYWNMDRYAFDAWLRERAEAAGADLRRNTRVSRIEQDAEGVTIRTSAGELRAQVAIDATGWRALGRKLFGGADTPVCQKRSQTRVSAPPSKAPHVHAFQGVVVSDLPEDSMWALFQSATTPYYGWLVPKGDGQFLLGAGFPQGAGATRREGEAASKTNVDPWSKLSYLFDYIEALGATVTPLDVKPEGCPITTITNTGQLWWGGGRLFPIGEAAGLVSPSSGDGIHFGLEHARALADALVDANAFSGTVDHTGITTKVQQRLRSSLNELRFNCLKSHVAAKAFTRGIAARLLPLYLRRPVERIAL